MSRIALRLLALIAAFWTISAQAADFSYRPQPAPWTINRSFAPDSWAGLYLGGNLGYAWGSVDNNPTKPSGFVGGAQAGYNFQQGQWVFGVEGDIQATGAEDTFAPWKFSNPWFGTVRGRAGYALNNILFYGTGGLAFGDLRGETFGLSESHTNSGMDSGGRCRIWIRPQLERQGRISLCRSREQPLQHHRRLERLPFRNRARRRELPFLVPIEIFASDRFAVDFEYAARSLSRADVAARLCQLRLNTTSSTRHAVVGIVLR